MSSGNGHPADDDKPKEHPPVHDHMWQPVYSEWREVLYYLCHCGAMKSA